jgi:tetratricopeptide (TPR) repeat protein
VDRTGEELCLRREKISNTRLRFADSDFLDGVDMLLGADFFLSHRVYVAASQEKIYVTYNGGLVFNLFATPEDRTAETDVGTGRAAAPADAPAPATADAFARRAAAFAARQDFKNALADQNRACEMEPGNAAYRLQRARIRLMLAQGPAALEDLNEAVRLDAADVDARLLRASVHVAMRNAAAAREDLAAADAAAPPQAHVRRDIANLYLTLGLPAAALPQLDQWITTHSEEVDAHGALNSRCWARALLGTELEKALADCNAAIRVQRNSAYLDSRGLVYLRMNRLDAAIEDYDAALKLSPRAAWSLYGRGLARLRSGAVDAGNADIAAAKAIHGAIEDEAGGYGLKR